MNFNSIRRGFGMKAKFAEHDLIDYIRKHGAALKLSWGNDNEFSDEGKVVFMPEAVVKTKRSSYRRFSIKTEVPAGSLFMVYNVNHPMGPTDMINVDEKGVATLDGTKVEIDGQAATPENTASIPHFKL